MEKKETAKKEIGKAPAKCEIVTVKNPDIVSATTTKLLNNIHKDLREVSKSFMRLGISFYNFKEDRLYKELGYKTFDAFVKAEFNLSKATAYTFISVATKFSVVTPEGLPTGVLKKEFQKFTSSQLVEMCRLDEDTLAKVKPTDTVREIKKLRQNVQTSEQNESNTGKSEGKKASGTAYSFDEIAIHKPIIDKYMNEKRQKEKKSYRIEIAIVWDDITDDEEVSGMNPPVAESNTKKEIA